MVSSAARVIEELGDAKAFAEKVGRTPGAVRLWKYRNYFPREAWPEIVDAFPEHLTFDRLLEIERAGREKKIEGRQPRKRRAA